MEVTFAKEYSAILKDLLHYWGLILVTPIFGAEVQILLFMLLLTIQIVLIVEGVVQVMPYRKPLVTHNTNQCQKVYQLMLLLKQAFGVILL